jgi:hypothetical protein
MRRTPLSRHHRQKSLAFHGSQQLLLRIFESAIDALGDASDLKANAANAAQGN